MGVLGYSALKILRDSLKKTEESPHIQKKSNLNLDREISY